MKFQLLPYIIPCYLHSHFAHIVGHVGQEDEGEGPGQVVELLRVEEAGHGPARPLDPHGGGQGLHQGGTDNIGD